MITRVLTFTAMLALVVAGGEYAATRQPSDNDVFTRIRQEALDHSQVGPMFATLTDRIGPRLTASPAFHQAIGWARDQMTRIGLSNVHTETWPFGRGWALDKLTVEMTEPRYMPLIAYSEAWSPSTAGEIVGTPVMIGGKTPAEVEAMRDSLKGAIVLTQPEPTFIHEDRPQPTTASGPVRSGAPPPPGPRPNPADTRAIAQILHDAGAAVLLRTSYGENGTVFVQRRDEGANALPAIVLAAEHYDMLVRLAESGTPVKVRINLQSHYQTTDTNGDNVIGELPGTDPQLRDDVVLLGAHIDSWPAGEGAADNADGVTCALEAMRVLEAIGARPKRTIRVALWGGEEEGLLGSRAYVQQHFAGDANKAARDHVFVYLNQDPGTGPIYGWYLENMPGVQPIFDAWLDPLKAIGARRNVLGGIGATDHLSFRAVGIPGFNAIQDYTDYDTKIHHTNMDMPERVRQDDLKEAAAVLAWFAYEASVTDQSIPRPAPTASGR